MYEVLDKEMMKSEIQPPFVCGKTWLCFKKATKWHAFKTIITS